MFERSSRIPELVKKRLLDQTIPKPKVHKKIKRRHVLDKEPLAEHYVPLNSDVTKKRSILT